MITYDYIAKNKRNSFFLVFIFLVLIIALGWVFSQAYGNTSILYFAVIFSSVSALFSYYFSDSITLALSGAREVDRQTAPDLYRMVENLTIAAGLPMPKVYIIEDSAMNAFATGRDPKHAVICFTTGIIGRLEKVELEGVTAHELSHIGNYDIRFMTLVVVLVGILTLLADWLLRASFFGGRRKNNEGGNLFMIIGLVLAILSPIIAMLIKLAVSRQREYLADASGALLTRHPDGLARALEKIGHDREPLEAANKATAHLYIADPFHSDTSFSAASENEEETTDSRGWFAGLFNTHPPIEDRIKRLREMNL